MLWDTVNVEFSGTFLFQGLQITSGAPQTLTWVQMFELLTVVMSLCWLTSVLAMPKMRGHRNQPLLSQAHSSQGQIQPIDHFVCPQHHVLEVVIVVSKEIRWSFMMICICLR